MDKKLEQSTAEKVRRRLARTLQPLGFSRTKTSFFTRAKPYWIEFIHLHKYSFAPGFRVHLGIRVLNDAFDTAALNGPDSHGQSWFDLDYDASSESIDECVEIITRFCIEVGESWFQTWNDSEKLCTAANSPLDINAKVALTLAINDKSECLRVLRSCRLLGVVVEDAIKR